MIRLHDVTLHPARRDAPILRNANAIFHPREKVGILAPVGSGKSSIARLICGAERPDSGSIERAGRVSWPIGLAGPFHAELGIIENLGLIADLLGEDRDGLIAFCLSFCDFGQAIEGRMKDLTPAQRACLAYACSLAVVCDIYVADETLTVGDADLRAKCDALLERRLRRSGLIFLSRNPSQLSQRCTRFYVLLGGKLISCRTPEIGQEALRLAAATEREEKEMLHAG
ncbi:ATP-binding cassette domain-containing protein [Aestuariibius insulae]|uniref:ATP-binding cassette domain-containing protein n=1 Tax=Aestuariibius insulae TaxID=2058287 RepID=UPI00345EE30F